MENNEIVRWFRGVPIVNARALLAEVLVRMGKTWEEYQNGDVDAEIRVSVEREVRKELGL